MLKNLLSIGFLILAFAFVNFAQTGSLDDEEFAIEATYLRRNVEFRVPNQSDLTFKESTDAAGVNFSYFHSIGKKDRRGDFAVGVEIGLGFTKREGDTIAQGRGEYTIRFQANGAKTFKPFVTASAGIARENFKQNAVCVGAGGSIGFCGAEWSETFGGGGGFDIGSRRRWRNQVRIFRTSFGNESPQWNFEARTGVVF